MKKVLNYIQQHGLIIKGDHVIVGVSGGADSVCLLFLLEEISHVLNFSLSVVHVNHNLRGKEADRDEAFVKTLCQKLQLPFEVYSYDIRCMAEEQKVSIEEAGRMARYEAFEMHCNKCKKINSGKMPEHVEEMEAEYVVGHIAGNVKIALAHHQNDLAETMIYHLARGTDLAGLAAIRSAREKYIRPLLCMNRREIEHYLKERNIEYVTDSTNEQDEYTRNKIRHNVVEYLEREINPRTAAHMAEASESFGELQDFLLEMYQEKYAQYAKEAENKIFLDDGVFSEKKVLAKGVIRLALEKLSGSLKNIGRIHIMDVYALFGGAVGREVSLPYGFTARKEYQGILILKEQKEESRISEKEDEVPLNIPGETFFGNYRIISTWEWESLKEIPQKTYTKWMDYDKIKGNLVIRTRKKGDYLVVNAQGGRKKLKDYLINEKIPQKERDEIPLICCGAHVVWVCGHRISEQYKVDETSKRIIRMQISVIHKK